jgi:hypothetical protein
VGKSRKLPGHGEHAPRFSHTPISRKTTHGSEIRNRRKRFPLWILLPLLLVPMIQYVRSRPVEAAEVFRIPPPTGIRTDRKLDVLFVFDDSDSTFETDPGLSRYRAANFAIRYLQCQTLDDGNDDRIGFVHFAETVDTPSLIPLTPVGTFVDSSLNTVCLSDTDFTDGRSELTKDLIDNLQKRANGGTAFLPPLGQSADWFAKSEPARKRVLLFFTDGESPETSDSLKQAISALGTVDAELIVLDNGGLRKDAIDIWKTAGIKNPIRLSKLRGNRLECEFAKILVRNLEMDFSGGCK